MNSSMLEWLKNNSVGILVIIFLAYQSYFSEEDSKVSELNKANKEILSRLDSMTLRLDRQMTIDSLDSARSAGVIDSLNRQLYDVRVQSYRLNKKLESLKLEIEDNTINLPNPDL